MKHSTCLFLLGLLFSTYLSAQVNDNFSDGDFSSNPTWVGDTDRFQISPAFELQSNGLAASDEIHLSTPSTLVADTEWRIEVNYGFGPSTSNQIRIYLMADQADLEGPLNGYFIGVGESGGDDSYDLFRQDGANTFKLIDGLIGRAGTTAEGVVKVVRDATGTWTVSTDINQTGNFVVEGSIFDDTYTSSTHMGVWVKHTSSRAEAFFFDDVYVGPIFNDTLPPTMENVVANGPNGLTATFSEALDMTTAEDINNYIMPVGLPVQTATQNPTNLKEVNLGFAGPFLNNEFYTLISKDQKDLAGNVMLVPDTITFLFSIPEQADFKDIIINEIFPDPSPTQGLPEVEYIELHNRSLKVLDLANWTYTNGTTIATFPAQTITPGAYWTVCRIADVGLFSGNVIGLDNWPALVNAGDNLELRNDQGLLIDQVDYEISWYGDPAKDDGGYSLELIRASNLDCPAIVNWTASNHPNGGTPGAVNSVNSNTVESTPPMLLSASVLDENRIEVCFDESMDPDLLEDPAAYVLTPSFGMGSPSNIEVIAPDNQCVILTFNQVIGAGTLYTLNIANLADCSGNFLLAVSIEFLRGEPVEMDGLSITELLADFEPSFGLPAAEYVEVYNYSNKALDLTGVGLSDGGSPGLALNGVIPAGGYGILCDEDDQALFAGFGTVIPLSGMPSLNNTSDSLFLYDSQGALLDFVFYSRDWFLGSDKADGGWSLEKIQPDLVGCNQPDNWAASIAPIGGTPGTENSVNGSFTDNKIPQVTLLSLPVNNQINLFFSEQMDPMSLENVTAYSLDPSIGQPILATAVAPHYQEVRLIFDTDVTPNQIYELALSELEDCVGNRLDSVILLGLPVEVQPGDILLNEILFNPLSGGSDYVEIYNASDNVLNLADLILGEGIGDGSDSIFNTDPVSETLIPFLPGTYLCLTRDVLFQQMTYQPPAGAAFLEMDGFPTYDDAAGEVVLAKIDGTILDRFTYLDDFHYPTLVDDDGVSLERISLTTPTEEILNWHSAAATVNYGTPGYPNSQAFEGTAQNGTVSLQPETFSPNDDGVDDVLGIQYEFPFPGANARITIFDTQGRVIKELQPNTLLSPEQGTFFWDGTDSKNTRADIGMYIVVVEVTNQQTGQLEVYRLVGVLADRL